MSVTDEPGVGVSALVDDYTTVRKATEELCRPLAIEDYVIQAMADVSPTRWHIAHVTWFFETFLLRPHLAGYQPIDDRYHYLFNSYYNTIAPVAGCSRAQLWAGLCLPPPCGRGRARAHRGGRRRSCEQNRAGAHARNQPRAAASGAPAHRYQIQPRDPTL